MARLSPSLLALAALSLAPARAQSPAPPTCPPAPAPAPADIECFDGSSMTPDALFSVPGNRLCGAITITCGPLAEALTGAAAFVASPCLYPGAVPGRRVRVYKGVPEFDIASVTALATEAPGVFGDLFMCNTAGCNAPAASNCSAGAAPPGAASATASAVPSPAASVAPCPATLPSPAPGPLSCFAGFASPAQSLLYTRVVPGAQFCVAFTQTDPQSGARVRVFSGVSAANMTAAWGTRSATNLFACATPDCNTLTAAACGTGAQLPSPTVVSTATAAASRTPAGNSTSAPTCPPAPAPAPTDLACFDGVSVSPGALVLRSVPGDRLCGAITITCGPLVGALTGIAAMVAEPCNSPNAFEGARVRVHKGLPADVLALLVALPTSTPGVFSDLFICDTDGCNAPAASNCIAPTPSSTPVALPTPVPCPASLPAASAGNLTCLTGAQSSSGSFLSSATNSSWGYCYSAVYVDPANGVRVTTFGGLDATTAVALWSAFPLPPYSLYYSSPRMCASDGCNTPQAANCIGPTRSSTPSALPTPVPCPASLPPPARAGNLTCLTGAQSSSSSFLTSITNSSWVYCYSAVYVDPANGVPVSLFGGLDATAAASLWSAFPLPPYSLYYSSLRMCASDACNTPQAANCIGPAPSGTPSALPTPVPCPASLPPPARAGNLTCFTGARIPSGSFISIGTDSSWGYCLAFTVTCPNVIPPDNSCTGVPAGTVLRGYGGVDAATLEAMWTDPAVEQVYRDVYACGSDNCNSVAGSNCVSANVSQLTSATTSGTGSPSATGTGLPSATGTGSPSATGTGSPSATGAGSSSARASSTRTPTSAASQTRTAAGSATIAPTPTRTRTASLTASRSASGTRTRSATGTRTRSVTRTRTRSATRTRSRTGTASRTRKLK